MGKLSQKLVVYLDQNFISEMAKADIKEAVNPQFKDIYELLHKGFADEKMVVPSSFFHDIESSFAPTLKERIKQYQGYLGQIKMQNEQSISTFQNVRSAKEFLGEVLEPVDYHIAYHDDPDQRTQMFNVSVDMHWEQWYSMADRIRNADNLQKVKETVVKNKLNLTDQVRMELDAARRGFLQNNLYSIGWVFKNDKNKLQEFVQSKNFASIPNIDISSQMWAKILVDFPDRPIGRGDQTDIEIISAFLPYVDVFAGDSFMINIIRQLKLNEKYNTQVFSAGKKELETFESYIKNYIEKNKPINRPTLSVFVLPDKKIRESDKCFEFFRNLGSQSMGKWRRDGYIKIYAFDDGNMPRYEHRKSKIPISFTGLQDIRHLEIKKDTRYEDVVKICKERSKSDKFILIDRYQKFEGDFLAKVLGFVAEGKEKVCGYKIFSKY